MALTDESGAEISTISNMDELSAGEVMPQVNEAAINAVSDTVETPQPNEQAAPYGLKADGTPAKKRGRKAGQKNAFVNPDNLGGNSEPENEQSPSRPAAALVSTVLERMQIGLISEDFIYSETERASNVKAWENAFDHYGGVAISPPLALVGDHIAIIMARAHKETTRSRFALFKAYLADKISSVFRRRKNALSGSGPNNERKNDIRPQENGQSKKTS